MLRPHAEVAYADELAALAAADDRPRPPQWRLSPWAVVTYLMGGRLDDGTEIIPKYIGQRRLIEIAVATLATDRALLLLGVPGTAKTWVSEHLAAAISGDSALLVQGTAGTTEESLRYGWNYALLLSRGPTEEALVPSPVFRAMREGRLVRVEELTRMPSEVQDALVTMLSEKVLPIPELATELAAVGGVQPHRHGQRPRSRRQRDVQCPASPLQHRRAAVAGHVERGDGDRVASRRRARRSPRPAGRARRIGGDRARCDDLPRAARRDAPPMGARASRSPAARCRRPRRSR